MWGKGAAGFDASTLRECKVARTLPCGDATPPIVYLPASSDCAKAPKRIAPRLVRIVPIRHTILRFYVRPSFFNTRGVCALFLGGECFCARERDLVRRRGAVTVGQFRVVIARESGTCFSGRIFLLPFLLFGRMVGRVSGRGGSARFTGSFGLFF